MLGILFEEFEKGLSGGGSSTLVPCEVQGYKQRVFLELHRLVSLCRRDCLELEVPKFCTAFNKNVKLDVLLKKILLELFASFKSLSK